MENTPNINVSKVSQVGGDVKVAVKLTQYSHGAGCGCKISPKILDQILSSN